jgi:hypothetical protein
MDFYLLKRILLKNKRIKHESFLFPLKKWLASPIFDITFKKFISHAQSKNLNIENTTLKSILTFAFYVSLLRKKGKSSLEKDYDRLILTKKKDQIKLSSIINLCKGIYQFMQRHLLGVKC